MICILAINITPVAFYHDVFSGHTDADVEHNHSYDSEVAVAGVNCHNGDFLADNNPVISIPLFSVKCPVVTYTFVSKPSVDFYSLHHFYAELRGPPFVV
jgi:hypothetical protein